MKYDRYDEKNRKFSIGDEGNRPWTIADAGIFVLS
jgi:hypothetical protein